MPADYNLPLDDEDEFSPRRQSWKDLAETIKTIYRLNMALALLLSLCGIILLLAIFKENVRRKSPLWYWFHIAGLTIFLGLCIHVPAFDGSLYTNRSLCSFIMYSVEYVFMLISYLLVLLNTEVLFSTVLQLQLWQSKPFVRFVVSVLLLWIIISFIVAHLIIANNKNATKESGFCLNLNKSVHDVREILRSWVPGCFCFLSSVVIIVILCVQKVKPRYPSSVSSFREMTTPAEENADKMSLVKMTLMLNAIFILRHILTIIGLVKSRQYNATKSPEFFIMLSVLMLFHSQTMYWLPFPVLFVAEVRSSLRNIGSQCVSFMVALYKGRNRGDTTSLRVRMEDVKEDA